MKKVLIKKALEALKKQAIKDIDLKDIKGGHVYGKRPIINLPPPPPPES